MGLVRPLIKQLKSLDLSRKPHPVWGGIGLGLAGSVSVAAIAQCVTPARARTFDWSPRPAGNVLMLSLPFRKARPPCNTVALMMD